MNDFAFKPSLAQLRDICRLLISERGESSGCELARRLTEMCAKLDDAERRTFLDFLAEDFSPRPEVVAEMAAAYRLDPSQTNLIRLQQAVEPPRQELFRRINLAPQGIRTLLSLRRSLLGLPANPLWRGVDADLLHLFRSWFNRGFLEMRRIDWRTSAHVLEKLIEYEAVHQIQGWRDLRRRLQADRRCFAFFHPVLPDEPIIFIEAALTTGMSARIAPLLEPDSPVDDPERATHAIFYSITNCQPGLRGISFGHFLIRQVAEDLSQEFPGLTVFATLSPVPGFAKWLAAGPEPAVPRSDDATLAAVCARYLLGAKREAEPLDPVARFHLGNGARLERINPSADLSIAGLQQSYGVMVNYVYELPAVESNHERYIRDGNVACSEEVATLAGAASPLAPRADLVSQP